MSSQGGKTDSNSSGISGWFFGNQDKNKGSGFSNGNSSSSGSNGSNSSSGNSNSDFGSISNNSHDNVKNWQSGRNANIWMPQSS